MATKIKNLKFRSESSIGIIFEIDNEQTFWYNNKVINKKSLVILKRYNFKNNDDFTYESFAYDVETGNYFPNFKTASHTAKLMIHQYENKLYENYIKI